MEIAYHQEKNPIFNSIKYSLIPKFSSIPKGARLSLERLRKIIIQDNKTIQEKEVFTKMLYNREVVLAGNFMKIKKVKKEVALLQKI